MAMDGDDIHLLPLDGYNDFENSSDESDDNDSIEVVSNVDEKENNIVDMTKNLVFSSDDELENNDGEDRYSSFVNKKNRGFTHGAVNNIRASFGEKNNPGFTLGAVNNHLPSFNDDCLESDLDASDDNPLEYYPLNASLPSSSSHSLSITTNKISPGGDKIGKSSKRKRRPWSVEEKLEILTTLKLNKNKNQTALEHGCTPAQLRNWLANEVKLISISNEKKGKLF
jgi:hypothetical protein